MKCTKFDFDFGWGSAPDPTGGAYSAPPDPIARFGGRFVARGQGWGRRAKGEGRGGRGKWRGRKGRAPKLLLNQGTSEPCYATAVTGCRNISSSSSTDDAVIGLDVAMDDADAV